MQEEGGAADKQFEVSLRLSQSRMQVDETEGPTYAAQYYAPTLTKYDYYLQHYAPAFRKKVSEKWGEKYVDFRTLMQVVD